MDNPNDNDTDSAANVFLQQFGAQLTDNFHKNPDPPPFGGTVTKTVGAKNTRQTDAYVRILVQPKVVANDGTLLAITPGASDLTKGSLIGNLPTIDSNATIQANLNTTDWAYGGDGYWYCLHPLKPGQSTADLGKDLFTKITLNAGLAKQYEGATLTVDVKCEAAGTQHTAFQKSFWNNVIPASGPLHDINIALGG